MKLPDSWIIELEDYKREELRGNDGIYDNFTGEQLDSVKAYFRWKTRKRFQELCKNTSLAAKPKKAEILSSIMGNAIDWTYDGCVDTGYLGASHCELGHALRYEHYAFSPSTGKEIIFGVNCAADFFGIDAERLRKINTVQEETLNEIKTIVFIGNTEKHLEYFKTYYSDVMEVVKVLGEDWDSLFGHDWNIQMANFWRTQLPFTASMVDRLQWVKSKYYYPKLEEIRKRQIVESLVEGDPVRAEFLKVATKSPLHLIKSSMSYISEYASDTSEYRIKCNQFVLKQAIMFSSTYTKLVEAGVKDFEKFVNSGKVDTIYTHASSGDRIATKAEVQSMVSSTFTQTTYPIGVDKYKYLQVFGWAITGKKNYYKDSEVEGYNSPELEKVEKSAGLLKNALKWLNSTEFGADLKLLAANAVEIKYADSAPDEVTEEKPLEAVIDYMLLYCPKDTSVWTYNAAYDMSNRYRRYGTKLTDKQRKVLYDAYNKLTGKTAKTDKPEVVKKAEYVLRNIDDPVLSTKFSFEINVCKTIASQNKASEKQAAIVEKAYNFLKSGGLLETSAPENTRARQIFVDAPENPKRVQQFTFDDQTPGKEQFVEQQKKAQAVRASEGPIDKITQLPTITEISQLLGMGAFKLEEAIDGE